MMVGLNPTGDSRIGHGKPSALVDGFGRRIDRLRLSVTSRCEMHCIYCQPVKTVAQRACSSDLSDVQRVELVRFLHEHFGLTRVRITGGEPLLHGQIVTLIAELKRAVPKVELAMTTNGRLLTRLGRALFEAGLDRLNVSLDSLVPKCYTRITGVAIDETLEGIEALAGIGFPPPKINTVVLAGVNDDQLVDLAFWAWSRGSEIRFLEAMPIGSARQANRQAFVSATDIRAILAQRFDLTPLPRNPGDTDQRFEAVADTCHGIVGLIAPVTAPFCGSCRRIRLTAGGRLYPCLLDDRSIDLRGAWSDGQFSQAQASRLIRSAVAAKQAGGTLQAAPMVVLGG